MQNGSSSQGPENSSLGSLPLAVLHAHVSACAGFSVFAHHNFSCFTFFVPATRCTLHLCPPTAQLLPLLHPGGLCRLMATCKQLRDDVRSADTLWEQVSTSRGWGPFEAGVSEAPRLHPNLFPVTYTSQHIMYQCGATCVHCTAARHGRHGRRGVRRLLPTRVGAMQQQGGAAASCHLYGYTHVQQNLTARVACSPTCINKLQIV